MPNLLLKLAMDVKLRVSSKPQKRTLLLEDTSCFNNAPNDYTSVKKFKINSYDCFEFSKIPKFSVKTQIASEHFGQTQIRLDVEHEF